MNLQHVPAADTPALLPPLAYYNAPFGRWPAGQFYICTFCHDDKLYEARRQGERFVVHPDAICDHRCAHCLNPLPEEVFR